MTGSKSDRVDIEIRASRLHDFGVVSIASLYCYVDCSRIRQINFTEFKPRFIRFNFFTCNLCLFESYEKCLTFLVLEFG